MLAPDWTWLTAIPVVLALVALLWIPGAALAGGLGAGRWPAIALAPLVTTSTISVGGILTDLVGVRWGIGAALFWLVALPAIVWAVRLLIVRSGRPPWRFDAPTVQVWQVVAGLAASVLIATWVFHQGTGLPGNIPQQGDQIFHLGTVRSMLDSGSISSLTADGLNHRDAPVFYPAAFHGVSATTVLFTGAPIVVVENSLLLVTCALTYPLGVMLMLNTLVSDKRLLVLLSGVLALAFIAFPWKVMNWGAVWGQVFGSAFIPAVVAVFGWGLSQALRGRNWGSAALLFVVGVPGLVLGHTSALFGAVVGAVAVALAFSLDHALERPRSPLRWVPFGAFVVLAALADLLMTVVAPAGMTRDYQMNLPGSQVVIGVLTLWGEKADATQFAGVGLFVLLLAGVVLSFRNRRDWWVAAAGIFFLVVGSLIAADGPGLVGQWTWPWYDFIFRVHGAMVIYLLPLVVMGAAGLLHLAGRLPRVAAVPTVAVLCAGLVAIVVVQGQAAIKMVGDHYLLDGKGGWITSAEVQGLLQLSAKMPPDAVVAASPWRGGQYLYVLGPQVTALPTEKASGDDNKTVSRGLKNIRTDPAVCAAVKRMGITYVITGGTPPTGIKDWYLDHAAVDEVSPAGGFRVVAHGGPYTLWSVPDCVS